MMRRGGGGKGEEKMKTLGNQSVNDKNKKSVFNQKLTQARSRVRIVILEYFQKN